MGELRQIVNRSRQQLRDRVATQVFQGRARRRWSQRELAQRCHVSEKTIRRIEHREFTPREPVLERLDAELSEDQVV